MMASTLKFRAASIAIGLLAGCSTTTVPAPVLLTLPVSPAASMPAAATTAAVLVVRRVGVPEYLVSRRVRYRADPATLAEWPNTYWAERIEVGVSREFVAALRSQLPGWAVCDANCAEHRPVRALQVDLVALDWLRGAQTLRAQARVTVSGPAPAAAVMTMRDLSYELPAGGDTPQAEAEAIANLVRRVAADAAPLVGAAPR